MGWMPSEAREQVTRQWDRELRPRVLNECLRSADGGRVAEDVADEVLSRLLQYATLGIVDSKINLMLALRISIIDAKRQELGQDRLGEYEDVSSWSKAPEEHETATSQVAGDLLRPESGTATEEQPRDHAISEGDMAAFVRVFRQLRHLAENHTVLYIWVAREIFGAKNRHLARDLCVAPSTVSEWFGRMNARLLRGGHRDKTRLLMAALLGAATPEETKAITTHASQCDICGPILASLQPLLDSGGPLGERARRGIEKWNENSFSPAARASLVAAAAGFAILAGAVIVMVFFSSSAERGTPTIPPHVATPDSGDPHDHPASLEVPLRKGTERPSGTSGKLPGLPLRLRPWAVGGGNAQRDRHEAVRAQGGTERLIGEDELLLFVEQQSGRYEAVLVEQLALGAPCPILGPFEPQNSAWGRRSIRDLKNGGCKYIDNSVTIWMRLSDRLRVESVYFGQGRHLDSQTKLRRVVLLPARALRLYALSDLLMPDAAWLTDADGDGLSDALENLLGTSKTSSDSDGDLLPDARELLVHGTSPANRDTDGDGIDDGDERPGATHPLFSDNLGSLLQPETLNCPDYLAVYEYDVEFESSVGIRAQLVALSPDPDLVGKKRRSVLYTRRGHAPAFFTRRANNESGSILKPLYVGDMQVFVGEAADVDHEGDWPADGLGFVRALSDGYLGFDIGAPARETVDPDVGRFRDALLEALAPPIGMSPLVTYHGSAVVTSIGSFVPEIPVIEAGGFRRVNNTGARYSRWRAVAFAWPPHCPAN